MTTSLARPAHWDDPDPVPGFVLQQRRSDLGAGEVWEAVSPDTGPVLIRLVDLPDDAVSRAKAARLAAALPLLGHPDLEPVRQVAPTVDGLALVRSPIAAGTTTLSAVLARRRSVSPAEVAGLADRLGRALGHLHDNGVTHGRFTAGDVLLRPNGWPLLTGFGVAAVQGAGGVPADDLAALARLLRSMLPSVVGAQHQALRSMLASAPGEWADGHAFADEVIRCSDPAPLRMRPHPGRARTSVVTTASQRLLGRQPRTAAQEATLGDPVETASGSASSPPVETLDAAVRALRADARQSARQQRRRPHSGAAPKPCERPARHLADRASRRRTSPFQWFWRVAPAIAMLLVTVVLGWRFVGPAATADGRPVPAAATAPAPDRATVARLDAARSAAFAAGATARLTAADAPGSPALTADLEAMSIMLSHQGRARGLAPRLISVTSLSRAGNAAVLRVVDELPPYDFVTPVGKVIARSPGHGRQVHEVRLRLVSGQWRYEAVFKPGPPASTPGGTS